MTEKQKAIFQYVKFVGIAQTGEIITQFEHWYYNGYGASRHIGLMLGRMVKAGFLNRVKRGHYQIASSTRVVAKNKNQLKLF